MTGKIVLASTSPFRAKMLKQAGVPFTTAAPGLDERAAEAPLVKSGAAPEDVSAVLAEAKAMSVTEIDPGALVIGSDQTLSLGDRIFHKPADMEAARRHLLALSGQTHQLNTAVAIVQGGRTLWRHIEISRLTMRRLEPAEIGRYLSEIGEAALRSVGSYQIEGRGIRLFERIEGDYFSIVGLPLLPLLAALHRLGTLDD